MIPRNTFHKAAEAMEKYRNNRIGAWVRTQLVQAQKFIVPDAGKMTAGKPFDDFKDVLRLPFPQIALLREIDHSEITCQQICIAVDGSLVTGAKDADFWVADLINVPGTDLWAPSRPIGIKLRDAPGVELVEIEGAKAEEVAIYGGGHDPDAHIKGFGALNGLSELLLMLSLHNVSTKLVDAPVALNKKRTKNGKLPLYDYHVLIVDGEEVYGRDSDAESDRKIRSHFRRGHIRRLDETRRVWVRAAFVRGSAPGFVDKDYDVRTTSSV